MNQIENVKGNLIKALYLSGVKIENNQIEIVDLGCPHETQILPHGKIALYAFFYKNECLKLGKVGSSSNSRFNSQHYNPNSSNSNLAKSLLSDNDFKENITIDNVGNWIKENTKRINIIMSKNVGVFVLNFCEAFLQLCFKPKYEGFKSQINLE